MEADGLALEQQALWREERARLRERGFLKQEWFLAVREAVAMLKKLV